ncbi:MAG: DUF4982 domain-containing protein [Firmicutes bacterium]|nr:DUF4982 domain-containing protein [Bacillota bacterium]
MQRQNLSRDWEFTLSGRDAGGPPEHADLPHDYSILRKRDPECRAGRDGGFFPCGIAEYKKTLYAPEDWLGKAVMLEFDGVYMNATVRVNHNIAAAHPYGYTGFRCDIAPFLRYGKNNGIAVNVNNDALPNSRWYSGSGVYRHVWLLTGEKAYVYPEGVYITTPNNSAVSVETTVGSDAARAVVVRSTVIRADGLEAASADVSVIAGKGQTRANQTIQLSDPVLWSLENPYLYTLRTEIFADGDLTDTVETKFGVRTVRADAENGFRLNGVPMKLKGGCVHHDCGILGSAAFDRAEERKVELLKQSGFNAVRTAHNPPSPAFLDACDRLGMIVMDEAFDCWREQKLPYDYHLYFADWWKRDMAAMIMRDRNHPSIAFWSTGNEIIERDGRSGGAALAKELADYARGLDGTRLITNAVCGLWGSEMNREGADDPWAELTRDFIAPLDVAGYNYLPDRYVKDGKLFPNRVIVGTETVPKEAFEYWELVEQNPRVIGDFVWTALDYLGEAGIGRVEYGGGSAQHSLPDAYPWNQAWCGDIDVCGFKRPQSYYRDFVWGVGTRPYIGVHDPKNYGAAAERSYWGWWDVTECWTWDGFEGKPIKIEVYSGGDEVELALNGASLGRKPAGKAAKYLAEFETVYTPGELTAITYENGAETFRAAVKTAGRPASIRLTPDRAVLDKFDDLSFVTVEVLDADGNPASQASTQMYLTVSGAGVLQAAGNNDPRNEDMYVGAAHRAHRGKAMAVVRAKGKGEITLCAAAEGIRAAEAVIEAR